MDFSYINVKSKYCKGFDASLPWISLNPMFLLPKKRMPGKAGASSKRFAANVGEGVMAPVR